MRDGERDVTGVCHRYTFSVILPCWALSFFLELGGKGGGGGCRPDDGCAQLPTLARSSGKVILTNMSKDSNPMTPERRAEQSVI